MTTAAVDTKVAVARLIEFLETGTVSRRAVRPRCVPRRLATAVAGADGHRRRTPSGAGQRPSLPGTGSRRAGEPDRHRVRHRVRGAVGAPGPELVLPGDDPGRRGGRHHRRDGGLLHRRLGRGQAARARQRRDGCSVPDGRTYHRCGERSIERRRAPRPGRRPAAGRSGSRRPSPLRRGDRPVPVRWRSGPLDSCRFGRRVGVRLWHRSGPSCRPSCTTCWPGPSTTPTGPAWPPLWPAAGPTPAIPLGPGRSPIEAVADAERTNQPELLADCLDAALACNWGPDELEVRVRLAARLDEVAAHVLDAERPPAGPFVGAAGGVRGPRPAEHPPAHAGPGSISARSRHGPCSSPPRGA